MIQFHEGVEFIDFVRNFHKKLMEFYNSLKNRTDKEKVKMVLDYISEHERKMSECLDDYESRITKKVKKAWYQFVDTNDAPDCFKKLVLPDELTVDKVIDLAVEFDNCLIKLYNRLADASSSDEARDVFLCLADMESSARKKLVRITQQIDDL